ncbi:solute carrier family 35 member F5-like [Homarus americanus]|uniref:solute carrier family 35 member F5-like n=1 Tax=Homarus americanus TaxID=6706 RepID=UPI001C45CD14|nr:solute carrier family 35 member F5-like [Homarus americanus]
MSENEAVDAMMSRLSFSASVRAEQLAMQAANKLSVKEVMKISSIFCLLWFAGNYSYQIALSNTEAGVVNIISSTSGLFTCDSCCHISIILNRQVYSLQIGLSSSYGCRCGFC